MNGEQKERFRIAIINIIDGFFELDSVMKELLDPKLKRSLLMLGNTIDDLLEFDEELVAAVESCRKEIKV